MGFRVENGVKIFELTTKSVKWNILDDVAVTAWTYNGTLPGPLILVTEEDRVHLIVKASHPAIWRTRQYVLLPILKHAVLR